MLLDRTGEGETSVNTTVKSPFQDYCHPHDQTERSMASLKPFRVKPSETHYLSLVKHSVIKIKVLQK